MTADPIIRGASRYDRIEGDFYATERELVDALLPHLPELRRRLIDEPACGDGAIARVLEERGYAVRASDLADRGYGEPFIDFLARTEMGGGNAIVTNPPYGDLGPRFVRHAIDLMRPVRGLVAMLLRTNFDCEPGRFDLFAGPPFRARLTCCWRPHWSEERRNAPRWASAWFIWDWRWSGSALSLYAGKP